LRGPLILSGCAGDLALEAQSARRQEALDTGQYELESEGQYRDKDRAREQAILAVYARAEDEVA
jgi:hypothetical protein